MKAPAFWYQSAGFCAAALSPLGQIYRAASRIRRAITKPYRAAVPVICVGNLVAGGAGKTPTALAIARLLQQRDEHPAFVTRGYGGRACGPLKVDPEKHQARDVGDEALLLARVAPCWIGCPRAAAVKAAARHATPLILDDGLQNPTLAPTVSFLVIDGASGLGNGRILPAGPLRETLHDALPRVAAIVLIGKDEHHVTEGLTKPVLHAKLQPYIPDDFPDTRLFLAFAGIGRPAKFFASCREIGLTVQATQTFPDHHFYTETELTALVESAKKQNLQLVTTAKDWVRLPPAFRAQVAALPVELVFEDPGAVLRLIQSSTTALRAAS